MWQNQVSGGSTIGNIEVPNFVSDPILIPIFGLFNKLQQSLGRLPPPYVFLGLVEIYNV